MLYVPRDKWASRGKGLVGSPGAAVFSPVLAPVAAALCTTAAKQVATGKPVNITPPTVFGTTHVGQTLGTTNGNWTQAPTSYAYKWQTSPDGSTGWTDIVGATSATYVLQAGDLGNFIRSAVQASNSFGADAAGYVPSAAVGPITSGGGGSAFSFPLLYMGY